MQIARIGLVGITSFYIPTVSSLNFNVLLSLHIIEYHLLYLTLLYLTKLTPDLY